MKVKVYVEGGGNSKDLKTRCRKGFSKLFEKAGLRGQMPGVVACGTRNDTFRDFSVALTNGGRGSAVPILLVDSETAVKTSPWDHLRRQDGWVKPPQSAVDQAHLMVQVMESWFLADANALREYFGDGFRDSALPRRTDIESIPKGEVLTALSRTSRNTTKGAYSKGQHSFQILELVDADTLERRAPHAKRLFDVLRERCG